MTSAANELSLLGRRPSDVRTYHTWIKETQSVYGSVTNFICQERLHWTPLSLPLQLEYGSLFAYNDPIPFNNSEDYKILRNDWPYGLAPGITHLVVWLKTPMPVKEETGDLTGTSRALVQDYVDRVFVHRLSAYVDASERVVWFKNWTRLQSVRGLEHVHVMVRDVPEAIIDGWVDGNGA